MCFWENFTLLKKIEKSITMHKIRLRPYVNNPHIIVLAFILCIDNWRSSRHTLNYPATFASLKKNKKNISASCINCLWTKNLKYRLHSWQDKKNQRNRRTLGHTEIKSFFLFPGTELVNTIAIVSFYHTSTQNHLLPLLSHTHTHM